MSNGVPFGNGTANGTTVPAFECGSASATLPAGIAGAPFQALVWTAYTSTLAASIVGNVSVIAIVGSQPRMRTVTNLLLANLAVGDLLMTLFCVPFTFVSMFVLQYWPFGSGLCRVVNYCQALSVLVSAYTLILLSADRYQAIMWPLRPRRRLHLPGAQRLVALVWFGALGTAAPIPIFSAVVQPSEWHRACGRTVCTEVWPAEPSAAGRVYSLALMLAQFAGPLAALVYTYGRIGWRLWAHRPPPDELSATGPGDGPRTASERHIRRARARTIRMMLAVVAAFVVCWLPFNVFMLVPLDDPTWAPLPYLWFAFHWLAMSHSCYNPLIYCFMNGKFRAGFRALLVHPLWRLFRRLRRCCGDASRTRRTSTADLSLSNGSVQTAVVHLTLLPFPNGRRPSPVRGCQSAGGQ